LVVFFVIPHAEATGYRYQLWVPVGVASLAFALLMAWMGIVASHAQLFRRESLFLAAWMAVGGVWFILRYGWFIVFFLVGLGIVAAAIWTLYRYLPAEWNSPRTPDPTERVR
jgi:hypothetical protein